MQSTTHNGDVRRFTFNQNIAYLLQRLESGLPDHMRALLHGASLYQRSVHDKDFAFILATHDGLASDTEHQNFLNGFGNLNAIHITGSAIGEVFKDSRRDSDEYCYEQSGFRPDQYCFGLALPAPFHNHALQIVFKARNFRDPLSARDIEDLNAYVRRSGAFREIIFEMQKSPDLIQGDPADLSPKSILQPKMAFILHCDISGHTQLSDKIGRPNIYRFNEIIRESVVAGIAQNNGGRLIRSEGDGFWIMFPATRLSSENAMRYFKGYVREAGMQIAADYREIMEQFHDPSMRKSQIRTGIAHGEIFMQSAASRYQPYVFEGAVLSQASNLVDAASRDHSGVHVHHSALTAIGIDRFIRQGKIPDFVDLNPPS